MNRSTSRSYRRALLVLSAKLLLGGLSALVAQPVPRGTISGRVLDDSTRTPLPSVNVFIVNSTMGAATDLQGRFVIRSVPIGTHEIIASIVGYAPHSQVVGLTDTTERRIEIRLRSRIIQFEPVEVIAPDDAEWRSNLEEFTTRFLGPRENAPHCKILNPEVLDFSRPHAGRLEARARSPLLIENPALGYRLYLLLQRFIFDGRWIEVAWKGMFEELTPADEEQREEWGERRERAYSGSLQHFLSSLAQGTVKKEGFRVFLLGTRTPWNQAFAGFPIDEEDVLSPGSTSNERILRFQRYMHVQSEHERPEIISPVRRRGYPMASWIMLNRDSVTINLMGQCVEPFALRVMGDWAREGVADAMPADYRPESKR